MRILMSILGVFAMFAFGRLVAKLIYASRMVPVPVETPPEAAAAAKQEPIDHILIQAEPERVYEHARHLEYFERYVHSLSLEVIADQPGEFFGVRVEHEGELYGTALVRFEQAPGRNNGTIASVTTKLKHELAPEQLQKLRPMIAQEIDKYLRHLKESCEGVLAS